MNEALASRPRGRKWVRRLALAAVALGAVGVLLALVLLLGLASRSGRGVVLQWAGSALESATGIHLTARDFNLSLLSGEIRLEELELRADGAESAPVLQVPAAEAKLSWRSLLSDRPQIYAVRLTGPRVDLRAPLPQPSQEGETKSDALFPSLDLHQLLVVGGSVVSGEVSENLDEWLDSWQVERVTLGGSLVDGHAILRILESELIIQSHRRPSITVDLVAGISAGEDREFAIENLELVGDALELRAAGRGLLEVGAPIELSLELGSDLAVLLPDLTSNGMIEASGDMTFTPAPAATLIGELRVEGRDFPAELLAPVLAAAGRDGVRLEGTQLDLGAELDLRLAFDQLTTDPERDLVSGRAELTWRREDQPLVVATVLTPDPDQAMPAVAVLLDLKLQVLPEAEGSRFLGGRVRLPRWRDTQSLELEGVRLEIRQDDLASLAETLGLTPEALGGLQPAGNLLLAASANGPIKSPSVEVEGSWRLEDQRLLELSARSPLLSALEFEAEILPDTPGNRRVQGTWVFPGLEGVRQGSFEHLGMQIDLPAVEESLTHLEELLEVLLPDPNRRQELLSALTPEIRNRLEGSLRIDVAAHGSLDSPKIEGAVTWVASDQEQVTLEASFDEGILSLEQLSASLLGVLPGEGVLRLVTQGRVRVESPVRDATLELQIFDLNEEIQRLDVSARLEGGTLTLETSAASVPGRIEATVPLAVLKDLLPDSAALADLPVLFDSGLLELEITELDLSRTSEVVFFLGGVAAADLEIVGVLDALISVDPSNPQLAIGALEVEGLDVKYGETHLGSKAAVRIGLDGGRIALDPARFQIYGPGTEAPLDLHLTAKLDPEWQIGGEFASLFQEIDLALTGTVDSSILTPFLAGGVATGPVSIAADVQGAIGDLEAGVRLDGPDASLVLPGKYRIRFSEPEVEFVYGEEGLELRRGRMQLNRGEVRISGNWPAGQDPQLGAEFEDVRLRLDHGLTVSLDGNLRLNWPSDGRRRLTGSIVVDRGSLRRDVLLERELIRMLNPSDLTAAGSAFQESMDLDIDLTTREGVRIKNNLADLRADWDQIRVRGTLANPTLTGSIDVDPGGLVRAYGQTVRIDQGSLIFSGAPGEPPRLDFETTTSAEDPRLRSQWDSAWSSGSIDKGPGGGFWDRYDPQAASNAFQADEFTTGLTSYFQNRFLQSISGGAPLVELSVQPLPLMGETDTTARVTMSYHLTPQMSYVLSQNPREAEGRTDIFNLENLAVAPSLRAQLFRNDQGNQGATLQQMLEFGGGRRAEDSLPQLGSIDLVASDEMSKRRVRRATGLRRGQPVAEGADFDIEIDLLDALAARGYPAAVVDVQIEPAPRNRVRVGISVEPGTRVDFEFSGDRPQRRARRDIVALYQPTGMEESPALETVRRDTIRALRARGFVDPQVSVTTEHKALSDPTSDRVIRVHGEGGRQVNPHRLEFPGLPEDVEQTLVAIFSSRLSRVELAVDEPTAEQLFSQTMRSEGYIDAEIRSRELSEDGSTLTVEVAPGDRRRLASIEIFGTGPELRQELDGIRQLQPGDPARTSQIASTAFLMEDHLREKGFAKSEIRTRIEPAPGGAEGDVDLFFDVDAGHEHRIGELRIEGLANTSAKWIEGLSQLETGDLLTDSGVTEARRQLARTGIFQRISIRREEPENPEATPVVNPITFDLEEHPRYRFTYGVRGESTQEVGVVGEVADLNFLGRGQTLGLRLIYSTLERNARLYWSIPRIRQTNKNLEFFFEARHEELDDIAADVREAWAQITFPWGPRSVHRFYTVYKRSETEDLSQPEIPAQRVVSPFSGWQVSYDTGERSFFETSTERNTLFVGSDLSFSSENLGSDYTGYGWFGQLKPQIPLVKIGGSALVWVHNYRTGLRESVGDVELPFFDRLFAGGEFSVRGYPTNSLGPQHENGTPLGGEAMFITNQELRFPVWSLISGVAFFDAGNVWATREDVDSTLFTSVGAGLRADSPIGPLRLDLAFPLDRREGDPEYKIYFGLGQTF